MRGGKEDIHDLSLFKFRLDPNSLPRTYDGFRMVVTIEGGEVTLYTRNGKIISHNSSMRATVTAS